MRDRRVERCDGDGEHVCSPAAAVPNTVASPAPSLSGMPLQKSDASWNSANPRAKYISAMSDDRRRLVLVEQRDRLVGRRCARDTAARELAVDGRVVELNRPLVGLVVLDERRAGGPFVGQQAAEQPRALAVRRRACGAATARRYAPPWRPRPTARTTGSMMSGFDRLEQVRS